MGREAFTGSRLLFMESEQEGYEQSLAAGTSMDFRADLMRRYFKRYPISLPHNEEPSSEWLAAVDDHEHDVEQDPESMSAEELATQKSLITVRRVQIDRWLRNGHSRGTKLPIKDTEVIRETIIEKLLGIQPKAPRKQPAMDVFAAEEKIQLEAQIKVAQQGQPKAKHLRLRQQVKQEQWDLVADKAKYEAMSKTMHTAALEEYELRKKQPFSTLPADRARAIELMPAFLQSVIDYVSLATGFKAYITIGGPEPKYGGGIGAITMYTKVLQEDRYRKDFGGFCGDTFTAVVVPLFVQYLFECYTPEEGQTRSLLVADLEDRPSAHDAPGLMIHHIPDRPVAGAGDENATQGALEMRIPSLLRSNPSPLRHTVSANISTFSSSRPLVRSYTEYSPLPSPTHSSLRLNRSAYAIAPKMLQLGGDVDTLDVFDTSGTASSGSIQALFGSTNPPYVPTLPFPLSLHDDSWLNMKQPTHAVDPAMLPLRGSTATFDVFQSSRSESSEAQFGTTSPPIVPLNTFWPLVRDASTLELRGSQDSPSANRRIPYDPMNPPVNSGFEKPTSFLDVDTFSSLPLETRGDPVKPSDDILATTPSKRLPDTAALPPKSAKRWKYVTVYRPGFEPRAMPQSPLQLPPMHVDGLALTAFEPVWVVDVVNYLNDQSFGHEWKRLLDAWFCRESGNDWSNVGRVGMRNAPAYVTGWAACVSKQGVAQMVQPRLDTPVTTLMDQYNSWRLTIQQSRSPLSTISGMHGAIHLLGLLFYARSHITDDDGETMSKWLGSVTDLTSDMCAIIKARDIADLS